MPRGAIHLVPVTSASPGVRARLAFTLIEVLVAISIVVALLAIAVPTIVSSFGDRRIEAEAERLAAAMASLRAESVRQRETLALYLEAATGEFGGELFIGPLENPDDAAAYDAPMSNGSGSLSQPGDTVEERARSVFEAKRPLTLVLERPSSEPFAEMLGSPEFVSSEFADPASERIRIAVCTASGQILASRPIWLHDGRSMFSVEVGAGVGNAIISPRRIILTADQMMDGEDDPQGDDATERDASGVDGSDPLPAAPEDEAP